MQPFPAYYGKWIAALPMYDWPELRGEVDAQWARLRTDLLKAGLDAPENLVRRNADMPPVSGGIRDVDGNVIAPDPATLPSEELDLPTLWRHPKLLFGQTCWGPMELGLSPHVRIVGQPGYDGFEGGQGAFYSSAIVMRRERLAGTPSPTDGKPLIPLDLLRGKRFAYNSDDSMSGLIALTRDLETLGERLALFSERLQSGGHRASIVAVAEGSADVAAIDCRSWALAQRFEPRANDVQVVGWTGLRRGLPYIASRTAPEYDLAV